MMRVCTIPLVALAALALQCGTAYQGLVEPSSDNTVLIVGAAFVVNNYYNERFEVYRPSIEVAIMGKVIEGGKEQIKGYWTQTDENGYFALANVPPGRYALKGIRFTLSTGDLLTISNPLRFSGSTYMLQPSSKTIILFDGDYFAFEPKGRVVNMLTNRFIIDRATDRTRHVEHEASAEVPEFRSPTGQVISFPKPPEYFINKHPQSAWVPALKALL
ncbi:MAG: hypothetical protein ONB17_00935 [candidate division KSB1 bacterium]|nr:hypothetical protein [candidate division KSB1 bacterium]MDZ7413253.1 hypothetical protein [candidate division KSB1 bacterium]